MKPKGLLSGKIPILDNIAHDMQESKSGRCFIMDLKLIWLTRFPLTSLNHYRVLAESEVKNPVEEQWMTSLGGDFSLNALVVSALGFSPETLFQLYSQPQVLINSHRYPGYIGGEHGSAIFLSSD